MKIVVIDNYRPSVFLKKIHVHVNPMNSMHSANPTAILKSLLSPQISNKNYEQSLTPLYWTANEINSDLDDFSCSCKIIQTPLLH